MRFMLPLFDWLRPPWYSNCRQNRARGVTMARLYIGNLPHVTAEHELQAWVEQYGFKVESVQVIRDLETGASRGFAFVELPEVPARAGGRRGKRSKTTPIQERRPPGRRDSITQEKSLLDKRI